MSIARREDLPVNETEHEIFALVRDGVPLTLLVDLVLGVPERPLPERELSWAS